MKYEKSTKKEDLTQKLTHLRLLGTWFILYGNGIDFKAGLSEGDKKKELDIISNILITLGFSLVTIGFTGEVLINQDLKQEISHLKKEHNDLRHRHSQLLKRQRKQELILEKIQQQMNSITTCL